MPFYFVFSKTNKQLVWKGSVLRQELRIASLFFNKPKMEKELIQQEKLLEFQPKTSITAISGGRVVSILFADITHVSKYGNETVIYTVNNSYRTYHSLKGLLTDLPVNVFFLVHQSHIVSLRHMTGVRKGRLVVGEYYVPMSRNYKVQLMVRLREIVEREYFFIEKIL